jgi:short-subunit dehydrogenase
VNVSGTTVLLTGASSGLGAALARVLAARGARLLLAGRNAARLRTVAAETGGVALEADLAAPDGPAVLAAAAMRAAAVQTATPWPIKQVPSLARSAASAGNSGLGSGPGARFAVAVPPGDGHGPAVPPGDGQAPAAGRIDILINNAGVGWAGPLTEMSTAQVARLVAVNLTAPIELTRLLTPALASGERGMVVFISSIAGATGVLQEAAYSATKAGLSCFAESLRYELAGSGVAVSVIVPGVVDTPFFARRGRPYTRKKPIARPAHRVARSVLTAIEHEQPVAYVPRWLAFPAWLHGAAPGTFRLLAARFG